MILVPRGGPARIDGILRSDEWSEAAHATIDVEPGWEVTALVEHDDDNLYIAFRNVEHQGKRLFPEILLDPQALRGVKWSPGQLWLHISNNLCEGNGEFSVYEREGVFQCAHTKTGWEANNPPGSSEAIEARISFAKMGITQPVKGRAVGMALDVTDATETANQIYRYWPEKAQIAQPSSWGVVILE